MGHSFTAAGRISSLSSVYNLLEFGFKDHIDKIIETKGKGCCLLQLLTLPEGTQVLTPLLKVILNYYEKDGHVFNINENRMNITLEDVLYVNGLPIKGNVVISDTNRDPQAVSRVLGLPDVNKVTYAFLKETVRNQGLPYEKRLVALLALVVASFICPTSDGNSNLAAYLQFVEKPDEVDDYAWGAALLAVLYCRLNEGSDANLWVLLCFFLIRIPKLFEILGASIEDKEKNFQAPMLKLYMTKLNMVSKNHKQCYTEKVESFLNNLEHEDISWYPYNKKQLPITLQDELPHVTRFGMMFFINYMARHCPISFMNQFKALEEFLDKKDRIVPKYRKIFVKRKQNKGNTNQALKTKFAPLVLEWDEAEYAEDYIKQKLNQPGPSKSGAAGGTDGGSKESDKTANDQHESSPNLHTSGASAQHEPGMTDHGNFVSDDDEGTAITSPQTQTHTPTTTPTMEDDNGENSGWRSTLDERLEYEADEEELERSRAKKRSKAADRSPEVVNDAEQMETNATSSRHMQSTRGLVHLCSPRPATAINGQSLLNYITENYPRAYRAYTFHND